MEAPCTDIDKTSSEPEAVSTSDLLTTGEKCEVQNSDKQLENTEIKNCSLPLLDSNASNIPKETENSDDHHLMENVFNNEENIASVLLPMNDAINRALFSTPSSVNASISLPQINESTDNFSENNSMIQQNEEGNLEGTTMKVTDNKLRTSEKIFKDASVGMSQEPILHEMKDSCVGPSQEDVLFVKREFVDRCIGSSQDTIIEKEFKDRCVGNSQPDLLYSFPGNSMKFQQIHEDKQKLMKDFCVGTFQSQESENLASEVSFGSQLSVNNCSSALFHQNDGNSEQKMALDITELSKKLVKENLAVNPSKEITLSQTSVVSVEQDKENASCNFGVNFSEIYHIKTDQQAGNNLVYTDYGKRRKVLGGLEGNMEEPLSDKKMLEEHIVTKKTRPLRVGLSKNSKIPPLHPHLSVRK